MKSENKILITSYDRTIHHKTILFHPNSISELNEIFSLAKKKNKKITFRGNANSYGDICFNKNNYTISNLKFNRILHLNKKKKYVKVESGVTIDKLISFLNKNNFHIKCIPGYSQVTIGGAISNNVHGKDSLRNGFFCDHVISCDLINDSGRVKKISTNLCKNISTLGLVGFIYSASIKIYSGKLESVHVQSETYDSLENIHKIYEKSKSKEMSFVWLDGFSKKNKELLYVEYADMSKKKLKKKNFRIDIFKYTIFWLIGTLRLQRFFFKNINSIFFKFKSLIQKNYITNFSNFYYPHKKIPGFYNLLYPQGFKEVQFFLKINYLKNCVREILELCKKHKVESYIIGIKFHKKNNQILNYTKNITASVGFDFDILKINKLITNELVKIIKKYDAQIYFAKDSLFKYGNFSKVQNINIKKFTKLKNKFDTNYNFTSSFYKRLNVKKI